MSEKNTGGKTAWTLDVEGMLWKKLLLWRL
jgi:hypothetical protein